MLEEMYQTLGYDDAYPAFLEQFANVMAGGQISVSRVFPIPRITQLPVNTAAFSGSMLMPAMTNPTTKPIVQT